MEVDDVQCKFPRLVRSNGQKMDEQYNQDDEEEGENKRGSTAVADLGGGIGRFYGWPSSRIVRVSRASGGKDRHSKVLTSKGLRDRRVRLSVNTAIQFYDLQDRLGCDQPSKAVEWLLKAAASSIDELPPINTPFPDTPRQVSDDKRSSTSDQLGFDSAEVDMAAAAGGGGGGDPNCNQHQVTNPSACSSNSETSKGSGLSLSRSESRIKARERAKERVAEKEKEKDNEPSHVANLNPISQTTSFTELLSAGINSPNCSIHRNPSNGSPTNESLFFQKSPSRHWSTTTPMDYFSTGLLGPPVTRQMNMANPALFSITGTDHQPELQHFSFVPDHLVSVVNSSNNNNSHNNGGSEYNLNFTISSSSSSPGLAGYNRGTLQSNSPLPHHHLQRFHPPMDGTSSPQSTFFIGTATSAPHVENNHHPFLSGYDSRLQLCYGDNHSNNSTRPSAQKGKGKN